MGRTGLFLMVVVALVSACSNGGGGNASATTTTLTTPATVATTTTITPDDAVKAAYLDYWKMSDRLAASPDPDDPELRLRAAEPLLSFVRDNLSSERTQGRTFTVPPGRPNDHQIRSVEVTANAATVVECFVDGRAELDRDGNIIDDAIVSKLGSATLVTLEGVWKLTALSYSQRTPGGGGCGA